MSVKLRRWAVAVGVVGMMLPGASSALASGVIDPAPIGPNQAFTAVVTGSDGPALITVVCDQNGPAPTGHPVRGQSVKVVPTAAMRGPEDGFTGFAGKAIDVHAGDSGSLVVPVQLRFYGVSAEIPTNVVVPCGGGGIVTFAPNPATSNAQAAHVKVTFVEVH